jgi:hypothetical protein
MLRIYYFECDKLPRARVNGNVTNRQIEPNND